MVHFIKRGNARIWTQITGQAGEPYVLMLSGGPGCCDYLESMARMLEDRFSVIRLEQRGCGRSGAEGPYDYETAVDDLEAARLFYGIPRWIVLGHSWGANLALGYALKYPEHTQSLIYLCGNGAQNDRDWSAEYHRNLDSQGELQPDMDYPFNPEVNSEGNRTWREYFRRPLFWREVANCKCPALFICAGADVRPNWPARQLQMTMSRSRMVQIEGAGHYIWLTHRERLREELRRFLL